MKFHKQVKIPGMNQDQIVAALRESELEMRPVSYTHLTLPTICSV